MPNTSAKNNTSPSSLPQSNSTGVNVGAVMGSLIGIIGGIVFVVGSFFLYKQYKNRKERNTAIPTAGSN